MEGLVVIQAIVDLSHLILMKFLHLFWNYIQKYCQETLKKNKSRIVVYSAEYQGVAQNNLFHKARPIYCVAPECSNDV